MDFTRDLRNEDHGNDTRRSFSRRVSFADRAHVRLFRKDHASDISGSQSSNQDDNGSDAPEVTPDPVINTNKENDYPGANLARRQSSVRMSVAFTENGEASMDVDSDYDPNSSPLPAGFLDEGSGIMDEEFDEGEFSGDDDDDMELTQAINAHAAVRRKSRVSFAPTSGEASQRRSSVIPRPPLAEVSVSPPEADESYGGEDQFSQEESSLSQDMSLSRDMSQDNSRSTGADSSSDHTQPMEFTIPLNKSLRQPEPPSDALRQLAAMTHSGDMPFERDEDEDGTYDFNAGHVSTGTDDMDLTDAQTRLMRARESLGLGNDDPPAEQEQEFDDDTFTSTEGDSAEMNGNETVNVTKLWRQSLGGGGDASSTMDLTTVQPTYPRHADEVMANLVPKQQSIASAPQPPGQAPVFHSSVFRAPSEEATDALQSSVLKQPPASNLPRSNVFELSPPNPTNSLASSSRSIEPRPQPVFTSPDSETATAPPKLPPPVKTMTASASPRKGGTAAFAPPVARPQPSAKRPLPSDIGSTEPSKSVHAKQAAIPAAAVRRPSFRGGLRRPSGYFAQRKSLGPSAAPADAAKSNSPKKKPGLGLGRASIGSVNELDPERSLVFERDQSRLTPSSPDQQEVHNTVEASQNTPRKSLASPLPMRPPPGYVPPLSASPSMSKRALEKQRWSPEAEVTGSTLDPVDQTERWRAGVPVDDELEEENNEPPISIEQFFAMTGVRFMDELAAPRRSTVFPSQLQGRRRSSLSETNIPLADYFAAMTVDVPQLELYSHVAKDLQAWIDHSKDIYQQAEEEAAKITPALFREYSQADEDVKEELLHQLKLIKSNNQATARSQWYDWRLRWVEQLQAAADSGFSNLQKDAESLENVISEAQDMLPAMRAEHAKLMQELQEEQAIADEIDNSDQDYLNELKNTISDQALALEAFRADVAETQAKHDRLQEKLDEIEAEKKEAMKAIEESKRLIDIQNNSTEAEAFKLKAELDALEQINLWRVAKVGPQLFDLVYASLFRVTVPCEKFSPIFPKIEITRTKVPPPRFRDHFPIFTDTTMRVAQQRARSMQNLGVKHVVQSLGDFWSACNQLRSQLTFLSIKFPLTIEPMSLNDDSDRISGVRAKAMVLLDSLESKVYIYFIWDSDVLARWPLSIASMKYDIKVAYGEADPKRLREAVRERISQATPNDHHACLLDACIEATLVYEQ